MKIGLVGAHGVGKSTLQKLLGDAFSKSILIPDFGRACPFETGLNATHEAQKWIINNQLHIEDAFKFSSDTVIFDNVSLAHYSYYKRTCGPDANLEDKSATSSRDFDVLIYLYPNPDFLVEDGLRPTDNDFQQEIYGEQLRLFKNNDISLLIPPSESTSWQASQWLSFIESNASTKNQTKVTQMFVALGFVCRDNEILFIRRDNAINPEAHNKWDIPGGRVEPLENIERAVVREVLEETGYLVKPTKFLPFPVQNEWRLINGKVLHINIVAMKCELLSEQPITERDDDKVSEIKWIRKNDIHSFDLIKGISEFFNEI